MDTTKLEQQIIITTFAAWVWTGYYGRGAQVKVSTISEALVFILKIIELAGEQNPIYKAVEKYILPVEHCIEGFCCKDPPAIPQLAIPASIVKQYLHMVKADPTDTHKAE
eukprot:13445364-Ditylum_brightwellii.AAC.1